MMKGLNGRLCLTCGNEFTPKTSQKYCTKACRKKAENKRYSRAVNLKQRYGISAADYEVRREAQNNECAICGGPPSGRGSDFYVDHDHQSGEVRGLLCHHCNCGLGQFKDNPALLDAAIKYLVAR